MNSVLLAAVMIASSVGVSSGSNVVELEARAEVVECSVVESGKVCWSIDGYSGSFYSKYEYVVGMDLSLGLRFLVEGNTFVLLSSFDND